MAKSMAWGPWGGSWRPCEAASLACLTLQYCSLLMQRYPVLVRLIARRGGATASGPALGNGYEIILQAFNWESYREPWYKVRCTLPPLDFQTFLDWPSHEYCFGRIGRGEEQAILPHQLQQSI